MEERRTTKGKALFAYNGHEYLLKRVNSDGIATLRCRQYGAATKCPSFMKILNGNVHKEPTSHCHESNLVKATVRQLQEQLKDNATSQVGTSTATVIADVTQNANDVTKANLPNRQALRKTVTRKRKAEDGAPPNPSTRDFQIPVDFQPLVLHDSGHDNPDRILFLGDPLLFDYLKSELWVVDGTFAACPSIYYQLYTVHAKVGNSFPPCVYILLPSKTRATYDAMTADLKRLLQNHCPDRILIDFELSAMQAFEAQFPGSSIAGCYFHLNQSLVRKVGNVGLKERFDTNFEFKLLVKSLAALCMVPPADVPALYDHLSDSFPANDEACDDLLSYFERTYVRGRGNRDPMFKVQNWNHFAAAKDKDPRTTNHCEGWHHRLNSMLICKHPSIWKLLKTLQQDIALNKLIESRAAAGIYEASSKKYAKKAEEIANVVAKYNTTQYDTDAKKLRYLSILASKQ